MLQQQLFGLGATAPTRAAEVAHLATAYQLGQYRSTFEPNKRWRQIIAVGVLALLVVLLMFGFLANAASDPAGNLAVTGTVVGLVDALVIGGFVWVLLLSPVASAKARERQFTVFEHGFVHVSRKGVQAYRWDAAAELYQRVVTTTYSGVSTGTNYHYRLVFAVGRTLTLNTFSTDMATFGPLLQGEIANVQLPRFWQALGAGHALQFGPYVVSAAGIGTASRPVVPWTQIERVRLAQGSVSVDQAGKLLPWGGTRGGEGAQPVDLHQDCRGPRRPLPRGAVSGRVNPSAAVRWRAGPTRPRRSRRSPPPSRRWPARSRRAPSTTDTAPG